MSMQSEMGLPLLANRDLACSGDHQAGGAQDVGTHGCSVGGSDQGGYGGHVAAVHHQRYALPLDHVLERQPFRLRRGRQGRILWNTVALLGMRGNEVTVQATMTASRSTWACIHCQDKNNS